MDRVNWVDNAKGIGILLVILGHLPWINGDMHHCIFSFHMPLFFIITGFFLTRSIERESFGVMLTKKFKSLVVPFLIFGVISATYSWSLRYLGLSDGTAYSFKYILADALFVCEENFGPWFLICLFFSSVFAWLIFKYVSEYSVGVSLLVSAAGFVLIFFGITLPLTIDIALFVTLFVVLGSHYYKKCPPPTIQMVVFIATPARSICFMQYLQPCILGFKKSACR